MSSHHPVRSYDEDLKYLTQIGSPRWAACRELVEEAVASLVNSDSAMAQKVIADDAGARCGQREIDEKAIVTIAKRQPMAGDLREIIGAIRISADLERVGDLGKNIAKRVARGCRHEPAGAARSRPGAPDRTGADAAQGSARRLCQRDSTKATAVRDRDDEIDAIYTSLFRELLTYMMEDPRNITVLHPSAVLRQEHRAHRRPRHQHRRDGLLHRHRRADADERPKATTPRR